MSEHVNDCDCCQRKLAALRIAGTIDGIHLRQRDAYRDVLRDLIAELRKLHRPYPDLDGELRLCNEGCVGTTPCLTYRYADRAEARLKGLNGDGDE